MKVARARLGAHLYLPSGVGAGGVRTVKFAIVVAVIYFLAARLGLALLTGHGDVAVFWPASGIAAGLLITLGARARPALVVGVVLATIAANLMGDRNLWTSILSGFCNAGEAFLAAWLIERWFGGQFRLDDLRRILGFLAAAGIATATSAVGGAAVMTLLHTTASFWEVWRAWFLSDVIGIVVIAPLVIEFGRQRRELPPASEAIEGLGVLSLLALISVYATTQATGSWITFSPGALIMPLLLWLAVRCRPAIAVTGAFIASIVVICATTFGIGRFGDTAIPIAERVGGAQLAVTTLTIFTLILTAVFAERRRNEVMLQDTNNRLQLALDAAELGVWTVDLRSGRFDNDARDRRIHRHDTGSPPNSVAKARPYVHPDDLPTIDAAFAASGRSGRSFKAEYRLAQLGVRSDPIESWVAVEGTVLHDPGGQASRLLGVTRDITHRKHAERALAERNAQLAIAGKVALVGSFAFNIGTGEMQVSTGYAAIHGLPEGTSATSRTDWQARVHPADLARLEENLQRDIDRQRSEHYCEYRVVHPAGDIRWIEARGFICYGSDGRPQRVIGVNIDVTARKRTEALLSDSNALLADALEAGRVMAFEWDAVTGRSQRSDNGDHILGVSQGGMVNAHNYFLKQVDPQDRERFKKHIRDLHPDNASYALMFKFIRPDGRQVWLEETAKGEFDGTGRLLRIKGLTRDITERKQTEDRLHDSERALRELLGALPAAIYVTDAAGYITYCNQSAVDLWGMRPNLGQQRWSDLSRFYHADGTPMALEDCPTEIALKQGRIVRGREAIIERPDGTRVPVIPFPTPLRDKAGAVVGVVNMTVDISERKKAELALAERNLQLALAGRAGLVGSYAYDAGNELMQVSEGYAAIQGLPAGTTEIPRSRWQANVHPDDRARLVAIRGQAFRERRSEQRMEYRIVRGGEVRWIESRSFISYDGDGRPQRVIGVNIDVTERKRADEQQRVLVAELDHRVKNVLATVSAVIAHTLDGSSSMAHFVAALDGRLRSMASTHELLSHSRWRGMPLAELIQRELAPYATGNNTKIEGPEVMLTADAGQAMAMVLHELVTNAVKHGALSTRHGRVSVQWYQLLRDRLVIHWQEIGGPAVPPSRAYGFGASVIQDLIPYELSGTVDYVLASEGVRCKFEIPAKWIESHAKLRDTFNGADRQQHAAPRPIPSH